MGDDPFLPGLGVAVDGIAIDELNRAVVHLGELDTLVGRLACEARVRRRRLGAPSGLFLFTPRAFDTHPRLVALVDDGRKAPHAAGREADEVSIFAPQVKKPNNSRVDAYPRGPAPRVVVDLETGGGVSLPARVRDATRRGPRR